VIGGGVAGMSAAVNLANQGIEVHLVEREKTLGGLLRYLDRLKPLDKSPKPILRELARTLRKSPRVSLHLGTRVTRVSGSVGDFVAELGSASKPGSSVEIRVGTIIVATGANELKPFGLYGYGRLENVVTELELEQILGAADYSVLPKVKNFVVINCVGARTSGREYCGRICCMTAIKNAQRLKSMFPSSSVTVLERDTMSCGVLAEDEYRGAREAGVRFVRYDPAKPPRVRGEKKVTAVTLAGPTAGRKLKLSAEMVVLTTPLVPQDDAQQLSNMLKIPLGQEGFFLEAHVKLRPVEFSNDGIYVCGSARFPANTTESISQAYAAAAKAAVPMRKGRIAVKPITAYATENECTGCGTCVSVCPYSAIDLEQNGSGKAVAVVTAAKCKGCGCCVASCPAGVMQQHNWSDSQLYPLLNSMEKRALPGEPKVLVFACNWCSYAGADLAGSSRYQIPHNVRVVRVMCSSRVKPESVVKALSNGIDGVMVLGCHPGECHYVNANLYTRRRAVLLKHLLELTGIGPERFRLDWVSASEGRRYAQVLEEFVRDLKEAAGTC
jgi:heterodisulfide reductase subunit A